MAKGQYLSVHQQKIVGRYYNKLDGIVMQKLGEMVSDLALAEPGKKADAMWKRAGEHLGKTNLDPARITKLIGERNITAFAAAVALLATQSEVLKKSLPK